MQKKILVANALPGTEQVAMAAMLPVLTAMGYAVGNLPTVLLSNPLNFSAVARLDTTAYMRQAMAAWRENGFHFDAICTGFLGSPAQVSIMEELFNDHPEAIRLIDPILGDHGRLYRGLDEQTVKAMRKLAEKADIITPNHTEAGFLLGDDTLQLRKMVDGLRGLGAKSVVITGARESDGTRAVHGYSHKENIYFRIPFELLDVSMLGTGDLFSAVLIGQLLAGKTLSESARLAMEFVTARIRGV